MYTGYNGQNYHNTVRVIKSTESISQLKNIQRAVSQSANGDKTSLPMAWDISRCPADKITLCIRTAVAVESTTGNPKTVEVQSASMDNLNNVITDDKMHTASLIR